MKTDSHVFRILDPSWSMVKTDTTHEAPYSYPQKVTYYEQKYFCIGLLSICASRYNNGI